MGDPRPWLGIIILVMGYRLIYPLLPLLSP